MIVSKYKIYLDMDGVLTDWEKQFKRLSGGVSPEMYESEHGKQKRYEFVYQNSPNYYATLDWMRDGKLLYNFLKELNTEILSHATDYRCKEGKLKWLSDNNITLKHNLVPNREDKANFAIADSILIDDNKDNVEEFIKAGGKAILHTDAIDTINKLKEITGMKENYRIYNSVLNPTIWSTPDTIKTDVLESMLKIANAFYKDTELTVPLEDIYFIGSSAGYNWTPTSDIDLHLVIDFKKINTDTELVKKYVDGLKSKWNESHSIKIGNHPVEVYIQDIDHVSKSQAVYSLMKNHWIKKPKHEDLQIDKDAIQRKYKQLVNFINIAISEQNLEKLKSLITRIYDMRQAGLDTNGEYSTENLVFKLLRSTGYINKIRDNIKNIMDKDLSKI